MLFRGSCSPSPGGQGSWEARSYSTGYGGGEGSRRGPDNHRGGAWPPTSCPWCHQPQGLQVMKGQGKPAGGRPRPQQAGVRADSRCWGCCRGAPGEAGSCSAAPAGARLPAPTSSSAGAPGARGAGPPEGAGRPRSGPHLALASRRQRHLSRAEVFSVWEREGLLLEEGCQGSSPGARL